MTAPGDAGPGRETVHVVRAVHASGDRVWEALTQPDIVARWWGQLSAPLTAGQMTTLNGDAGDSFLLDVIRVDPPVTLQYTSRLLAIGPRATTTWRVTTVGDDCLVAVTDDEPGRLPEVARRRWQDLLQRLDLLLTRGESVRDSSAIDFELSIELPGAVERVWDVLLDSLRHTRRCPLLGAVSHAGASHALGDGEEPSTVDIGPPEWRWSEHRLSFQLKHPTWLSPTACLVTVRPGEDRSLLTVRQDGWEGISVDDEYRRRQRRRFVALWCQEIRSFTLEYVRGLHLSPISPSELQARLGEPGLIVLDANTGSQWRRGHIPGAIFVGPDAFAPELLPSDRDATLVFYCSASF